MKHSELEQIQSQLIEMKEQLLSKTFEFRRTHLEHHESGQDEVEISHQDVSTNLAIELQERDRLTLIRIERALEKIKLGQFGLCEACGGPIQPARLKIQPLARLCVDCMHDYEAAPSPLQ